MQKMEAIGTLAGGIAHDFNNILSAIIGYADLALITASKADPVRYNLEQISEAGFRARDLVKQILAFSRQNETDKKPLKMSTLIKGTVKMLRASIPSNIEIYTRLSHESDWIMADATQIQQVLMNLCTNAWQAMRSKGTGTMHISLDEAVRLPHTLRTDPELQDGPYLELGVSDTGQGIPPGIMERIFEPYFTTKDRGEGTGLGLALVDGIVKDHGGAVAVWSAPGKGATFKVYLPQLESAAEMLPVDTPPVPRGKGRILYVDDEAILAEIGQMMLANLGYEVVFRTSSVEALEAFRDQPSRFDLVITDLAMPKMTGMDLAREIVRIRPGTPVIMCTGFSGQITPQMAKATGIQEILPKPIVTCQLAEAVKRVMDKVERDQ